MSDIETEDRIELRNPDTKKKGRRIDPGMYEVLHRTALEVVPKAAPGITLEEYLDGMATQLPRAKGWDRSASATWYAMAIKLDLEAKGELKRINNKPPQRLVRAD